MRNYKQLICIIFLIINLITGVNAQSVSSYSMTPSSGTFTSISGSGTSAGTPSGTDWDEGYWNGIPIGFTFNYGGTNYTHFHASTNGWLTFGTAAGNNTISDPLVANNIATGAKRPVVAPLWDDISSDNCGYLYYQVTGSSPNKILTIEWYQSQWNYNTTNCNISFQVKLYETSNNIEFVYQQHTGAVNSGSASIGIGGTSGNYWSLNGTGTSPSASSSSETTNLSSKPATGQIYLWSPCSAASISVNPIDTTKCEGLTTRFKITAAGTSLTYQWQESTNGGAGWNNISAGGIYSITSTSTTSTLTLTGITTGMNSYRYRCIATATCGSAATSSAGILTVNTNSIAPTAITGTSTICNGSSTSLTVSGGSLGTGASWSWYSGSCAGTPVGTGNSINVSPTSNTTYYVKAVGTCNTTACASQTVTVETNQPTTAAAGEDQFLCTGTSAFTLAGNTPTQGTGAWSILNGTGSVTTPASPNSGGTVTNANSSVTLKWAITNTCGTSYDYVIINRQ